MKILTICWFLIVLSSPFIVHLTSDIFQETGWLAIGEYNFEIGDGIYRSFLFFAYTTPVVLAIYLGRPQFTKKNKVKLFTIKNYVGKNTIIAMILFCFVVFIFDLGITGVEVYTGGWRLSGLVHYIRAYIFLILIGLYIFGSKSPSFLLIVIYATVAGITANSRFVVVSPFILYLLKVLIEERGVVELIKPIFAIAIGFFVITNLRLVFLHDDYTFSQFLNIISRINVGYDVLLIRGFSEIFMRIGIGRDVILAYEVKKLNICYNYLGLFFGSGSCSNPASFYGFYNDQTRFGIAPPMLASLVASLNSSIVSIFIIFLFSLWAFVLCISCNLLTYVNKLQLFCFPIYCMQIIFITIGPIRFAFYLFIFNIAMFLMSFVIKKAMGKSALIRDRVCSPSPTQEKSLFCHEPGSVTSPGTVKNWPHLHYNTTSCQASAPHPAGAPRPHDRSSRL